MLPSHFHLRTFASPDLPETIYFDTSFIVSALVEGVDYHEESFDFIKRLEEKQPAILVSKISKLELWCAAIRICISNLFLKNGYNLREINIDNILYLYPGLIKKFHEQAVKIQKDFDNLLQRFETRIIEDVKDEIIDSTQNVMQRYNLGSYDAIHIATMQHWKTKDIIAFDHAIEDISDLTIWTHGGAHRHKTRWYKRSRLTDSRILPPQDFRKLLGKK